MLVTNFSAGCQSIRKASSFLSLLVFAVNRPYSIHLSRYFFFDFLSPGRALCPSVMNPGANQSGGLFLLRDCFCFNVLISIADVRDFLIVAAPFWNTGTDGRVGGKSAGSAGQYRVQSVEWMEN